jgi:hypothetical protein
MKVKATAYSIKSDSRGKEGVGYWPKKWKLSGSSNGNTWTVLDEITADSILLKGKSRIATCQIPNPTEYEYFRLEQIGNNWAGTKHFVVQAWEIYGTLVTPLP